MKKTEKQYPFPEPDKNSLNNINEYYCPSVSWGDMTGLIPYAAKNDGEIESYNAVYPYLPDETENVNDL